jgi:hypothetical protein
MRVFRPVVEPTANLVTVGVADLFHRCGIRAKPVGDDVLGSTILLHDALQKLERRSLVPLRGDHRFQNLAFVIDSPPEITELAIDFHKDLIQMPPPLGEAAQMRNPLLSDLCANIGPNRFHQNRTVSWLMSIPRSAKRSSEAARRIALTPPSPMPMALPSSPRGPTNRLRRSTISDVAPAYYPPRCPSSPKPTPSVRR